MIREKKIQVIAAINSGSSSLKFGLFCHNAPLSILCKGKVSGIGTATCSLAVENASEQNDLSSCAVSAKSAEEAAAFLIEWLKHRDKQYQFEGIGHRVVHGGLLYQEPVLIDDRLMNELNRIRSLAPLHLPDSISIINVFRTAFPGISQLAHFDTAFHNSMPFEAKHYAIPRHFWTEGVVRYGFHGISCEYVYGKLTEQDHHPGSGKIIIAHLGGGSSITALKDGRSVETSMGFSPTGGVMMNTRAGDIDPGMLIYLLKERNMNADELEHMFNMESGIKAVAASELPMEKLIEKRNVDSKALQAIQMYSYHVRKQIGALAAAMGGLDIVVFTGGVGERSPEIRQLICSGLEFLGIELDSKLNHSSAATISDSTSAVKVYIIPTNEELAIAQHVKEYLESH